MNYTIYIAADLDKEDRFFGEENKSGLINTLLREYYDMDDDIAVDVDRPTIQELDKTIKPLPIDYTGKVPQALKSVDFCKHGYARIRCKYAKNGKPCKE